MGAGRVSHQWATYHSSAQGETTETWANRNEESRPERGGTREKRDIKTEVTEFAESEQKRERKEGSVSFSVESIFVNQRHTKLKDCNHILAKAEWLLVVL